MPLKFSQYYTRSGESFDGNAISADGESFVSGDYTFGSEQEGRILRGPINGTLNELVTGSYSSNVETGQDLAASADLSSFVYETESLGPSFGFKLYAWRDGLGDTLLVTNSGNRNFTNPAISADGNTVAYHSSGQVIIKQWSGSSWQVKGSSLANSDFYNRNAINSDGSQIALSNGQIYQWSGTNWTLLQTISGAKEVVFAKASNCLAVLLTGEIIVYHYDGSSYSQMGNAISGLQTGQTVGDINYDGTIIVTTAAKVFYLSSGTWTEIPFSHSYLNGYNKPTAFSFANDSKKTLLSSANTPIFVSELITVPKITDGQILSGKAGVPFSATPSLVDGPSVYWQASGLPTGLSINPTTGLISGTPTVKGAFTVTVLPSSETTTYSWRWGIPSTLTIDVADRDRLFYGAVVAQSVYAGPTPATDVYYGAQKLWPN